MTISGPLTREQLAARILEVLGGDSPRTAREITAILRATGLDVQRHEVNSILYSDLAGRVLRDEVFRWRAVQSARGETGRPQPDPARPALLRTVHRLRSGLPPLEHLERLTVAPERVMTVLTQFLQPAEPRRWLLVAGDYGTGKTHSLTLIQDMARRAGLATCFLSADGWAAALNHPQRFLHALLSTMEIPGHLASGYQDVLHGLLLDPPGTRKLRDIVTPYLVASREIDREVNSHLSLLASANLADRHESELVSSRDRVTYFLCGHSIAHRAGADARALAYLLLRIAHDVAIALGSSGLVLLLDEVESIYTKLPAQARMGAYRVLAALCHSGFFPRCSVAVAMTPDACRQLALAIPRMLQDGASSSIEPVASLACALRDESVITLECRPLTQDIRIQLLQRVRDLYVSTYPETLDLPGREVAWREHVERAVREELPVRVLVRQAVDFLDRARYAEDGH